MKIKLVLLVSVSLLVFQARDAAGQWVQTSTHFGDYVTCLAGYGEYIFAETSFLGMILSTDMGGNWTGVNKGPSGWEVSALVVSGGNLFAGVKGHGVFFSTDTCVSWSSLNNGLTI